MPPETSGETAAHGEGLVDPLQGNAEIPRGFLHDILDVIAVDDRRPVNPPEPLGIELALQPRDAVTHQVRAPGRMNAHQYPPAEGFGVGTSSNFKTSGPPNS